MISRFVASAERLQLLLPVAQSPGTPLGILDSSFNPPTNAHLELASLLRARVPECTLVLMLSTGNADKPAAPLDELEHRLEMVFALLKCIEGPVTIALTKEPYFIDKARALRREFPGSRQVFAMGSDTLVRLCDQKYYHVPVNEVMGELYQFAQILVLERRADSASGVGTVDLGPYIQDSNGNIMVAESNGRTQQVSSSRVRQASRESRELLAGLVPRPVAEYILAHNLYG